ncbi:MAG: cupin domain-containing protein [Candidatus Micrarchaeota archaeon]|nr:cupin domain-containing protein [Candidatus Micrarchaeota archaeon]
MTKSMGKEKMLWAVSNPADSISRNIGAIIRNKGEIVFEFNRALGVIKPNGKDLGIAFAQIHDSESHLHKKTTEYYFVTEGSAKLKVGSSEFEIKPNSMVIIYPGTVHAVSSISGVNLFVLSNPRWKPSDHFKAKGLSHLKRS